MTAPTGPSHRSGMNNIRRGALPLPTTRPQQAAPVPMPHNNFPSTRVSPSDRGTQNLTAFASLSFSNAPKNDLRSGSSSVFPNGTVSSQMSTSLVPSNAGDDFNHQDYADQFSTIYGLIEGWAKTYANQPNLGNDQKISRENNVLWEFMMNCTYPGRAQDAHSHVMLLLNEDETRRWFVMRMCVAYIVNEILDIEAFKGYSKDTDKALLSIQQAEKTRGETTC